MVSDYLEVVISFVLFFNNVDFFYDFIFHKSEIRTVLLEVGIDLGLLKKALLKTSKIVLMYSNSLARQFSSMFHAKCLLPRLDRLLLLRSCLQNFYQCKSQWSWAVVQREKKCMAYDLHPVLIPYLVSQNSWKSKFFNHGFLSNCDFRVFPLYAHSRFQGFNL